MALKVVQQYIEVLGSGSGVLEVVQQYIEVLGDATIQYGDGTDAIVLGQTAVGTLNIEYVTDTLTVGQTVSESQITVKNTDNALTIGQTIVVDQSIINKAISNVLTTGQTLSVHNTGVYQSLSNKETANQTTSYTLERGIWSVNNSIVLGYGVTVHQAILTESISQVLPLTQQADGRKTNIEKSASSSILLTSGLGYVGPYFEEVDNQLTFDSIVYVPNEIPIVATNSIALGNTVSYVGPHALSVSSAIALIQYADTTVKARPAQSDILLGQSVSTDYIHPASSHISLGQLAERGLVYLSVITPLLITQSAHSSLFNLSVNTVLTVNQIIRGSIAVGLNQQAITLIQTVHTTIPYHLDVNSAVQYYTQVYNPDTIAFDLVLHGLDQQVFVNQNLHLNLHQYLQTNHLVQPIRINANAISCNAVNALALTIRASNDQWVNSHNQISLGQTLNAWVGPDTKQQVSLAQTAQATIVRALNALNEIAINSTIGYQTDIDVRCQYHPFVGGEILGLPQPPSPNLPPLPGFNGVKFYWPYESTVPTYSWSTTRKPDFGNKDQFLFQRINRETRGGRKIIFADPIWPKDGKMVMAFTTLTEQETTDYIQFLENTLGLEIGFTDWLGRIFRGVIVNVESPVVRNGKYQIGNCHIPGDNAITVEFEITTRAYSLETSNALTMTEGVDRINQYTRSLSTGLQLVSESSRSANLERSSESLAFVDSNPISSIKFLEISNDTSEIDNLAETV